MLGATLACHYLASFHCICIKSNSLDFPVLFMHIPSDAQICCEVSYMALCQTALLQPASLALQCDAGQYFPVRTCADIAMTAGQSQTCPWSVPSKKRPLSPHTQPHRLTKPQPALPLGISPSLPQLHCCTTATVWPYQTGTAWSSRCSLVTGMISVAVQHSAARHEKAKLHPRDPQPTMGGCPGHGCKTSFMACILSDARYFRAGMTAYILLVVSVDPQMPLMTRNAALNNADRHGAVCTA